MRGIKKIIEHNQKTFRNYSNNDKSLPPYGRKLLNALQCGYKPINDIFLYVGNLAWHKAKHFSRSHDVLLLPLNEAPDKFIWPVSNNSVLCFDTGGVHYQIIRKLAHSLLTAGATVVRVASDSYPLIVFNGGNTPCKH